MMLTKVWSAVAWGFLCAVGIVGCSGPENPGTAKLYFEFQDSTSQSLMLPQPRASGPEIFGFNGGPNGARDVTTTVPTFDQFGCFGVNVMGSGIASSDGHESPAQIERSLSGLLAGSSYCSYPGIVSPPIRIGGGSQSMEMIVPVGKSRIIQLVGVRDRTGVCNRVSLVDSGSTSGSSSDSNNDEFFEMGRVVTDLFQDKAVEIENRWPSYSLPERLRRKLNCGDGNGYRLAAVAVTTLGANISCSYSSAPDPTASGPAPSDLTESYGVLGGTAGLDSDDGIYSVGYCDYTGGLNFKQFQYSFSALGIESINTFARLRIRWKGTVLTSALVATPSTPGSGGFSVAGGSYSIYVYSASSAVWERLTGPTEQAPSSTNTFQREFALTTPGNYIWPSDQRVYVRIVPPGGGAGTTAVFTDLLQVSLEF